jgi:hypothetical protein
VTLASGSLNSTGNDFANKDLRMIMGLVLEDTDKDNVGEEPIPMVTVELVDASGTVVGTATTDSNVGFLVNVPPSIYTVVEANPPGEFFDATGSDGDDPNVITVNANTGDSVENVFVDELLNRAMFSSSVSASPSAQFLASIFGKTL